MGIEDGIFANTQETDNTPGIQTKVTSELLTTFDPEKNSYELNCEMPKHYAVYIGDPEQIAEIPEDRDSKKELYVGFKSGGKLQIKITKKGKHKIKVEETKTPVLIYRKNNLLIDNDGSGESSIVRESKENTSVTQISSGNSSQKIKVDKKSRGAKITLMSDDRNNQMTAKVKGSEDTVITQVSGGKRRSFLGIFKGQQ